MTHASTPLSERPSPQRLVSLDAFRGFTIAGMIVVNDPGSWSHVYTPLLHADWHGITLTDFVFPFFLYIVGVSIALAYTKRLKSQTPRGDLYKKIVIRSLKIFAVGLFLWLFPRFNFEAIRLPGVLQRIAIVFLFCAVLFLNTDWKKQAYIAVALLLAYWMVMTLIPVPIDDVIREALATGQVLRSGGPVPIGEIQQISSGWIASNLEPGTNLQAWVDRTVVPGRLWERTWDPEGLLSTIPALATGICGMLAGALIVSDRSQESKIMWLFFLGFMGFLLGSAWHWVFPINKNLWTSSFVVYTAGIASMTLAASLFFVDLLGRKNWTRMGVIFGANAITAYVIAGMLPDLFYAKFFGDHSLNSLFFQGLTGAGLAPKLVSLLYAILFTLVCYIPIYFLYRKKIFIKL